MRILGIDPGLGTMGWGVIETDGVKEREKMTAFANTVREEG